MRPAASLHQRPAHHGLLATVHADRRPAGALVSGWTVRVV